MNTRPSAANHGSPVPAITSGHIARRAIAMYRAFPRRVLAAAVAVFAPVLVLETLLHRSLEHAHDAVGIPALLGAVLGIASSGMAIAFGELLFSGVMDGWVGAALDGAPLPGLTSVVRFLPVGTLLFTDIVLVLLLGVAEPLVVPAIAVLTLTCVAGPVVIVERSPALPSLVRSARLVWSHFGTSFVVAALPMMAETAVVEALVRTTIHLPLVAVAGLGALLGVSIGAFVGLSEVVLGHTLMRLDAGRRRSSVEAS